MDVANRRLNCFVKNVKKCVTAWVCMTASGTASLMFTDDVTADESSRIKCIVWLYSLLKR